MIAWSLISLSCLLCILRTPTISSVVRHGRIKEKVKMYGLWGIDNMGNIIAYNRAWIKWSFLTTFLARYDRFRHSVRYHQALLLEPSNSNWVTSPLYTGSWPDDTVWPPGTCTPQDVEEAAVSQMIRNQTIDRMWYWWYAAMLWWCNIW